MAELVSKIKIGEEKEFYISKSPNEVEYERIYKQWFPKETEELSVSTFKKIPGMIIRDTLEFLIADEISETVISLYNNFLYRAHCSHVSKPYTSIFLSKEDGGALRITQRHIKRQLSRFVLNLDTISENLKLTQIGLALSPKALESLERYFLHQEISEVCFTDILEEFENIANPGIRRSLSKEAEEKIKKDEEAEKDLRDRIYERLKVLETDEALKKAEATIISTGLEETTRTLSTSTSEELEKIIETRKKEPADIYFTGDDDYMDSLIGKY